MNRWIVAGCLALALAGCSSQKDNKGKILAYVVTDGNATCAKHADSATCGADTANACVWLSPDIACMDGMACPKGLCGQKDTCIDHKDATSCAADSKCAWSATKALVPVGADPAAGGFCHAKSTDGDACACVSPVSCPPGAACPQMECDCAGGSSGGSSGGSCTCACPDCAPGQACPPCACSCDAGSKDDGCVFGGTCACACAPCAPGTACPPCDCGCMPGGEVAGSAPTTGSATTSGDGTRNCTCPACAPGAACEPCSCDAGPAPVDPCNAHGDPTSCDADTANSCNWFAMGACACPDCAPDSPCPPCECSKTGACVHQEKDPCGAHVDPTACQADAACVWYGLGVACPVGETCRDGVCSTKPPPSDPGECACACPAVACDRDSNCLPCACSCGGGGSTDTCVPPPPEASPTDPPPQP